MSEQAQVILAVGVAAALVLVGLAFAAPALFTAVGLAISAAKTGTAASLPVWLVNSTTVVVNLTLVTGAAAAAAKTAGAIKRHLFTALAVTMGALEGAIMDALKLLWPTGDWLRIAFAAAAGLLFAIGALFWHREGVRSKLFAIILFLLAPITALLRAMAAKGEFRSLPESFASVPGTTWLVLGAIAVMILATVLAHVVLDPGTEANAA